MTPDDYLTTLALALGCTPADLLRGTRTSACIARRRVAVYCLRRAFPELGTPAIAALLGYADHTTVLYHCRLVAADLARDAELAALVATLLPTRPYRLTWALAGGGV